MKRSTVDIDGRVVPGAFYSVHEIARHRQEQPVVAAREIVPIAAVVRVFLAGTHRPHRGATTVPLSNYASHVQWAGPREGCQDPG